MTAVEPPSGAQWEIRHGAQRAVVVEVGGGLRSYEVDGESVLDGYPLEAMADGGRGQPLLPWPNRLADGRYTFQGTEYQLPIDEVSRGNAIHGLTRWLNWSLIEQEADRVVVGQVIHPRPGYPFALEVRIAYSLGSGGLAVRTLARNVGGVALPFGAGQHPYLTVGTPLVDVALLRVPAETWLELDDARRLPTGRLVRVEGTRHDFRQQRLIGEAHIDDCFRDLVRDADGRARASLSGSGRTVTVWLDEHYRYLQVFSGDTLAPARRRRGLAIEPMTCPPNAFSTGIDVLVLEPLQSIEFEWGISVT